MNPSNFPNNPLNPSAPEKERGPGFEWRSPHTLYGWPLIHIAFGKDAKGKLRIAKGWIAIGQFAIGMITLAQFGVGILFGFGQFIIGLSAIAQFAFAFFLGIGQFATGYYAIGQLVLAHYGIAQTGFATYFWGPHRKDPEAREAFLHLAKQFGLSIEPWFPVKR